MGFLTIGIGLALAVYFLCEGFRNMKKPYTLFASELLAEDEEQEFISMCELPQYLGISKEEAEEFIHTHSEIPRFCMDGKTYFSKAHLYEWLND